MDFNSDKQVGRTRVNFVSDSKKNKNKKTHVQHKKNNVTVMDKLFQHQNELFKDGLSPLEYKNYVQEKINNEKFYYKNLSSENFEELNKRYTRMVQDKKNKLNLVLSERVRQTRQKKLFKDKKRGIVYKQKKEMIEALFKELAKTNALGIAKKNSEFITSDPDKWVETKKRLFLGGRYFEKADKEWVEVYKKIVSVNSAHLFDMHSHEDLNNYVMDYDNIKEEVLDC